MRLLRLLKNDLARETSAWVQDKIISLQQAESICARYGIDYHNQLNRKSYGYYTLVFLGYLFVGLAVITFVGANWENIPRAVRMLGLISLTTAVNFVGYYKFSRDEKNAAVGFFFLGGVLYGASIMLIAQIYHIGEHFPDGIFWWAAGVLPLALILESTLLMILAATLGYIWFFVEASLHYYPTMFPVLLAAMAWHCLKARQSNIVFMALILGLAIWAEYCLAWILGDLAGFSFGKEGVFLGVGLMLAYHGVSKWLVSRSPSRLVDYGTLLGVWTLRFAALALTIFSFEEPWRELIRTSWQNRPLIIGLAIFLANIAVITSFAGSKKSYSTAAFALSYIAALLVLMSTDNHQLAQTMQVADNLVLLMAGIWLIVRGIQSSITHYFFLGVMIILITGLLRYIDLVGDYIGATLLFAVFAIILLSVAKFWKSQQQKKRSMA